MPFVITKLFEPEDDLTGFIKTISQIAGNFFDGNAPGGGQLFSPCGVLVAVDAVNDELGGAQGKNGKHNDGRDKFDQGKLGLFIDNNAAQDSLLNHLYTPMPARGLNAILLAISW